MKLRKLSGVKLVVSDKCLALLEAVSEAYPEARWQRCAVPFYRNVFNIVPRAKIKKVAMMLKSIHAQEDRVAAEFKINSVCEKIDTLKLKKASEVVRAGAHETLSYFAFPREHWRYLRTNNMLERVMKEIRRRTRVVGSYPDGNSALMLVAARLRHVAGTKWGTRKYMIMVRIEEAKIEQLQFA